jgi:2-isopropylmalate synthase
MGLRTRKSEFGVTTGIKTPQICRTSRLVSKLTGFVIQRNKAIVGSNAFAHEAGIHQHGVLASPLTYEIMHPEDVGWQATRIVLGKHSGRHALVARIKELGYEIPQSSLDKIFARFKELADKKKQVYDEDITALVEEESLVVPEVYSFEYLNVTTGNKTIPTATVGLKKGKQKFQEASCGDGPVDAAFKAVDKITGIKCRLDDYSLHSISGGKDALGDVSVRVFRDSHSVTGYGSSTDIIEASVKAYINAINRLLAK